MKKMLLFLVAVLLFSCSADETVSVRQYDLKVDRDIILEYGQCLEIMETDYELCVKAISDSRCPSNVTCVW
ncbi:MAG: hypothetical protein KJP01_06955, partial [Gramella sp.]|nr:hypothetical protein [Christiangramia sp.]